MSKKKEATAPVSETEMQNEVEADVTEQEAGADAMSGAEPDPAPGPDFQLTPPPAVLNTPDPTKPAKTKPVIGEIEAFDDLPDAGPDKKNPTYPWERLNPGRMFKLRNVAKQGVSRSAKLWAEQHPGYTVALRDGADDQGDYIGVYRTA